jgi:hypothetical protein
VAPDFRHERRRFARVGNCRIHDTGGLLRGSSEFRRTGKVDPIGSQGSLDTIRGVAPASPYRPLRDGRVNFHHLESYFAAVSRIIFAR